jgi:hypothetical protein
MLLTNSQWAETNPGKRRLVAPNLPLRCVGLTGESPIFLVELFWGSEDADRAIRSVLVPSPEELIKVVREFGTTCCRVFHVTLSNGDRDAAPMFEEVIALQSYREYGSDFKSYVFVDRQGRQRPCFSWFSSPHADGLWEDELRFDGVDQGSIYD